MYYTLYCYIFIFFLYLIILQNYYTTKLWMIISLIYLLYNSICLLINFYLLILFQPSKKYLVIPVILRVVYIPLFLICNYQPMGTERILPVLIKNDWVFWVIAITMGLTSGYLSSLSMMYCPR